MIDVGIFNQMGFQVDYDVTNRSRDVNALLELKDTSGMIKLSKTKVTSKNATNQLQWTISANADAIPRGTFSARITIREILASGSLRAMVNTGWLTDVIRIT